jgi:hypothetical protein
LVIKLSKKKNRKHEIKSEGIGIKS